MVHILILVQKIVVFFYMLLILILIKIVNTGTIGGKNVKIKTEINHTMQRIFLGLFLIFFLGLGSCKTTDKDSKNSVNQNNGTKTNHTQNVPEKKDPFPLDKEGWLTSEVFQVIETIDLNSGTDQSKEVKIRAIQRSAHIIAMQRYKLYKNEFFYIDKLASFPPFIRVMSGKIVNKTQENGNTRFVYRVQKTKLQARVKGVINAFEELNIPLRRKIRENDFTF